MVLVGVGVSVGFGFDGPFKVRPASAAVLSPETMRAFHLGNRVRLRYGTVITIFDPTLNRVILVAQPVWRGVLKSPEERGLKADAILPVLTVPGMARVTRGGVGSLGDVHERDVFYVKHVLATGNGFLSSTADSDISARDGFTEFTTQGRAEIEAFTQEVAVHAADDFVPLADIDPELRRRLEIENAELKALFGGLEEQARQSAQRQGRPSTSSLLPTDFGGLDRA
jgi:hypothetical protein